MVTARIHTETTQPQFPIQHPKMGSLQHNKILCLEHAGPTRAWEFYATHMKIVCPIIVPNTCVCAHRKGRWSILFFNDVFIHKTNRKKSK
jgi:hypothetical protein